MLLFARSGGLRLQARTAVVVAAAAVVAAGCVRGPTSAPAPLGAAATGLVVLPPDYDPARAYPVVEILPPTGNTAEALLQIYLSRVGLGRLYRDPPERQLAALLPYLAPAASGGGEFLVILARGRGSLDDYRTAAAWSRTIARYERQVRADFRAIAAQRRVDTTRFVVTGFSMGGDLAWALALRNPELVRGAIVMASRASYRPGPGDPGTAALQRSRFFLTMGAADDGTRRRMARAAAAMLDERGIAYRFRMIEGAGHEPAPIPTFAEALRFVLRRDGTGE